MAQISLKSIPAVASRAASAATSAPSLLFDWAAATDAGRIRTHNEDNWHFGESARLFTLADGMGGYNAGEVASAIAIEQVQAFVAAECEHGLADADRPSVLERAITAANAAILAAAARRPECLGMGTTMVCAWLDEHQIRLAHVGDSRAYLLRDRKLTALTRDHSVGQAMVDAGVGRSVNARQIMGGVLTRALGVEPVVQVESSVIRRRLGDRLLLCSDGLTDMLPEREIRLVMQRSDRAADCAQRLVAAALAAGGHDNVTAMAVFL